MNQIAFSIDVEPDLRTGLFKGISEGLYRLELLMDKYGIKPTLFVTCDCIEKFPSLFRRFKNKGWEISLHGYRHVRFDELSFEQKEANLKKSIACFKKYLKIKPLGFRAAQHSLDEDTLKLLKKYKIVYDSSLNPWNFYHFFIFWKIKINQRYNFTNPNIHYRQDILEIPISSSIMPFSGLTLRVLPESLLKLFFFFIKMKKFPVFFIHSWDLIELKDSKLYNLCPLEQFLSKLDLLLRYFSKKSKFRKIEEIYSEFTTNSR